MLENEIILTQELTLLQEFDKYLETVREHLTNKYGEITSEVLAKERKQFEGHVPYDISNEELTYQAALNRLLFEITDKPEVYVPRGKKRQHSQETIDRINGKHKARYKVDKIARIKDLIHVKRYQARQAKKTLPFNVFYKRKWIDTFMKYHKVSTINGSAELVIPPDLIRSLLPFSGVLTTQYKKLEVIPPPLYIGVFSSTYRGKERRHPKPSAAYTLQEMRAYAEALIEGGIERLTYIDTELSRKYIKRLLWQAREELRKNYDRQF